MKKYLKIVVIILLVSLGIYTLFIVEESIRLKNGGNYPLIILNNKSKCEINKIEKKDNYKTNCQGLGYEIKREYVLSEKSTEDNQIFLLVREEFWLFDKFMLWGWVT